MAQFRAKKRPPEAGDHHSAIVPGPLGLRHFGFSFHLALGDVGAQAVGGPAGQRAVGVGGVDPRLVMLIDNLLQRMRARTEKGSGKQDRDVRLHDNPYQCMR